MTDTSWWWTRSRLHRKIIRARLASLRRRHCEKEKTLAGDKPQREFFLAIRLIENRQFIFLVGDDAQELERFLTNIFIIMNGTSRNEDHITGFHFMDLITDPYLRMSAQDILLVFNSVGVARHPAALLHGKF